MKFNFDYKTFFLNFALIYYLPSLEKPEFLPLFGSFIIAHCIKPNKYINKANRPKNFATGWEKLAPNKKLNTFFKSKYKFVEGLSQISHSAELIKEIQLIFFILWIKKLKDIKVRDHRQDFVVIVKAWESPYSFNSSLISFQNHTDVAINTVEIFVIKRA